MCVCVFEQKLEIRLAAKAESESKADYAVCCACALQRLPSNLTSLLVWRRHHSVRAQKYYDNAVISVFCALLCSTNDCFFHTSFALHSSLVNYAVYSTAICCVHNLHNYYYKIRCLDENVIKVVIWFPVVKSNTLSYSLLSC